MPLVASVSKLRWVGRLVSGIQPQNCDKYFYDGGNRKLISELPSFYAHSWVGWWWWWEQSVLVEYNGPRHVAACMNKTEWSTYIILLPNPWRFGTSSVSGVYKKDSGTSTYMYITESILEKTSLVLCCSRDPFLPLSLYKPSELPESCLSAFQPHASLTTNTPNTTPS